MKSVAYSRHISCNGVSLFTVVCLPCEGRKFPTLLYRTPYVDREEENTEEELCARKLAEYAYWLEAGYAVVYQHCRGRGKSDGDCIPYIYEREDGLALQNWVRAQNFYNGELFLRGSSYGSSVHFVTAPFALDVKGAILEVQDQDRYNCNYRNGFYKIGLHGGWYVSMYKRKTMREKNYTTDSYRMLPLSDFSKTVFGERAADFDEILRHPDRNDPFWQTRFGGGEAKDAITHAQIPILLTTGFYDIYTGGVFDMWRGLDEKTRARCALAVHPYGHGGTGEGQPVCFENGTLSGAFENYKVRWLDFVRGKCDAPFALGKVTYYQLFENKWHCDDFYTANGVEKMPLGEGSASFRYNPLTPTCFKGGLSANFGGTAWQDPPSTRGDMLSIYTPSFEKDTVVKGKMRVHLAVSSDAEDTCFYVRLSLCKPQGDLGLRDDINKISNFVADYRPGEVVGMEFSFDEHAFLLQKGERIRVDIASSAYPYYVPHTNRRGLFSEQVTTKVAANTVVLEQSFLELPTCT